MAPICRARLLSDLSGQTACDKEATSSDGRLCAFHSRQCQALYRGYKKRNAELDVLSSTPPDYLAGKKGSVASNNFADVDDEATLKIVHDHLFKTFQLLDRVIRARKLHHSHFFAIDNDYGHQKYLDKLLSEKQTMAKAMEKLGKRAATVMYEQKQWFDWVKETQAKEEKEGETESKKVKLEALLFQRHQKELKRQQREAKAKEIEKQQEKYLDETYNQRLSDMSEEEQDDWDPIKDVYGYERDNYVELIKYFLMLQEQENNDAIDDEPAEAEVSQASEASGSAAPSQALSKSAKKRAKKANAETKKLADPRLRTDGGRGANIIGMETKARMRERLRKPVKFEKETGWYVQGTGPQGSEAQTPIIPDDEIEQLLGEVAEIKNFLFCRLLLAQSTLLPVALGAESIEEFLGREEVTREHLRDLCLKLERPLLQDVRDACADFIRERDGVEDLEEPAEQEGTDDHADIYMVPENYRLKVRKGKVPENFRTKREKSAKNAEKREMNNIFQDEGEGVLDFGKVTDESRYIRKRTRIKICGRYMYNYPSEKALTRGGWFHFSIIAKDSNLFDAVELCRNWNEFFELNILCLYHYFPAPKWTRFIGDLARQQLLQLGFIPYFHGDKAEKVTNYFQTGSRGMARRAHQHTEMRNFVCGHIKRDDPVSRRFIQYLAMETWELRALVRDAKTGRVLISPPEAELWLLREKSGWGRASRNEYNVVGEVGPAFFEAMDKSRKWHFGFEEFYDVYIWDSTPGRPFFSLQKKIEQVLTRATRVRELKDMFSTTAPILKTLTKDPDTDRVRSIKPDEKVQSIWDGLDENARAWSWSPQAGLDEEGLTESYKYTEADEVEDTILFPLEVSGLLPNNLYHHIPSAMEMFETAPMDLRRFAADLDTDEEVSSSDGTDLGEVEDDGDPDWIDEGEPSHEHDPRFEFGPTEEDEVFEASEILAEQFGSLTFGEPDYFVPILRDPNSKRARQLPKSVKEDSTALMWACRLAVRSQQEYDHSPQGMESDFYRHIDRQKSKVFKQSFHLGDAEPDALSRYIEHKYMVDAMDDFIMSGSINTGPFELCRTMGMADMLNKERRIVDDAFRAYASIAIFFEGDAFLASEHGEPWRDTKLLNQEERAKHVPDRRTHLSNKSLPKDFWDEWDELLKANNRTAGDAIEDIFPLEWRKALRAVIIKLFKAGVICSSYGGGVAGVATAKAEPGRNLDMYVDYRVGILPAKTVSHLPDPTRLDRNCIVKAAADFESTHASARFSVLRLWSSPHFYPLMLGIDRRPMYSFLDDRSRCWEWKFVPKDMPYSEWSIHQQLAMRLQPYERVWGKQVWVAKDLVVVMGKDEKELRRFSEGVTWAVQTQPWRMEVDFWRSFVNVDVQFLEGLDPQWLS